MAIELGIGNINQAHIFDMLSTASTWATPIEINNGYYYWVSRQVICRELALLKIKPDTVYRHLKGLSDLGLINYEKSGVKDCICLTEKGKTYFSDTISEIKPSEVIPYVGNKSEQARKQIRNNSEMNPIYPTYKHPTTNISLYKKINLSCFDDFEKEIAKKVIDYRLSIKAPLKTVQGVKGRITDITDVMKKHKLTFEQVMDLMSSNEWKTIKADYNCFDISKEQSIKGTVENISDESKLITIANLAEKQGINPWENGEVKQSVIDAFENGELEILKLA